MPPRFRVDTPVRVGIARLLAALAADRLRLRDRAAIVVDLGTAITVDLVDVDGAFAGGAAREMGVTLGQVVCAPELAGPARWPRCVRVVIHLKTEKPARDMVHVYLREAKSLRPDMQSAQ